MGLFRHPLYLLWAVLAAAGTLGLGLWAERRRRAFAALFASAELLPRLFPTEALESRRRKLLLRVGCVGMLLVALAAPQWGIELVTTRAKGTQVVIAVDTSLSMLAEDLPPDRMQKAKSLLSAIIDGLKGERVGLLAFAGEAYIQCPLTTDIEAAKSLLRRMRAGMVPQPGTAIGKAIRLGTRLLRKYPGHKALVLLTDGEDHQSQPESAAQEAAQEGVSLFIIGIGTLEGAPIPVLDDNGKTVGYKKDTKGSTVVSRLGENGLIALASASGGAYFRASPDESEVSALLRRIMEMDKSDMTSGSANRYKNRFRAPLCLALLLLLVEMLLGETRAARPLLKRLLPAGALLCLLFAGCSDSKLMRGNRDYKKEQYGEALKHYEKADPKDPKTVFNRGAAHYKLGDFEGAQGIYDELLRSTAAARAPSGFLPKAYYNLGNSLFRKERLPEAVQAYKRCLLLDPKDEDCRHNLVLALRPPKGKSRSKDSSSQQNKDKDETPSKPKPEPKQNDPKQGQGGMSKEDADRILQAVQEKERSAEKNQPAQKQPSPESQPEADW
ncbi:MAG: VWA domain-containing protein [Elusimicrobiota bacterium]